MARIRTIKPSFWKHEDLSELSEATHLLAAALLNYADDDGYFNANPALVKAECSPLREPSTSIRQSLDELSSIGYLRLGDLNGKRYGRIVNFKAHQRVDRPQPSSIKDLPILWDESPSPRRTFVESSTSVRCGNGREEEGNGKGREEEGEGANAPVADATPDCPHSEIVGLYHSLCPSLPRVRDWTDGRRKALRTLWRDKPERQRIEFWHEFFAVVGRSPFLVGANDRNWTADIDWLLKPANFQKVLEGKYEARPQERFSKTTQSNLKAVEGFLSAINGR